MKKLFLLFVIFCTAGILNAQWGTDTRLTNNPAMSCTGGAGQKNIAVDENIVHVVWQDSRDVNWEIFYKRSSDGGGTWEPDFKLTNEVFTSDCPSVAVSGFNVHVVWRTYRDGNWEIYYKRSIDGGVNWDEDKRLTNDTARSFLPAVCSSDSLVFVVWEDYRNGNSEIYFKRSTDVGLTWSDDMRLSQDTTDSFAPSVAVSNSIVHVVWCEYIDSGSVENLEIYHKRSTDFGLTWEESTRLTFMDGGSVYPCVSASGLFVHVVWSDSRIGKDFSQIFYKRSADGGKSWESDTKLSFTDYQGYYPSIATVDSVVHVVWEDYLDVFYKRSNDNGLSWEYEKRLTYQISANYPSISVSDTIVHVVWQDFRDNLLSMEIYYKRKPPVYTPVIEHLELNHSEIIIYPNPVIDYFNLKFAQNHNSEVYIKISNEIGISVIEMNINKEVNNLIIPTNSLVSGIYLLTVVCGNDYYMKKLVVIK